MWVPSLILRGAQKVFFSPSNQVRRQYRKSGYPPIHFIRYYKLFKAILPLYKGNVLLLLLLLLLGPGVA